jgi:protein TonB
VNEAVDRLIAERERLDAGLPGTLLLSIVGHLGLIGAAVALPLLLPRQPLLRVSDFSIVMPRGGGGSPIAAAQAAPAPQPAPAVSAAPPAAPKVLKPPTEAPRPNALPALDSKRIARRAAEPAAPAGRLPSATSVKSAATAGGAPGARGTSPATPGLEIGPPGVGVPDGTETGGDWYIAAVTQKIWMLWNQTIKPGFAQPIGVTFTIMPDGSITGVRLTQACGVYLLDSAAQRAVLNAAPFGPFPRDHEQKPRTIQAVFRPTS